MATSDQAGKYRKIKDYAKAYVEGKKAGRELEQAVKFHKSHKRIFLNHKSIHKFEFMLFFIQGFFLNFVLIIFLFSHIDPLTQLKLSDQITHMYRIISQIRPPSRQRPPTVLMKTTAQVLVSRV